MALQDRRIAENAFQALEAYVFKMQSIMKDASLEFERAKRFHLVAPEGIIMYPEYIMLHHSLTRDSKTVSWDDMKRYHTAVKGWKDIGYHYGIELVETEYIVLVGRMMTARGSHCPPQRMNRKSLGICFVGNYDSIEPPTEALDVAYKLVCSLIRIFDVPVENVVGHREVAQDGRTCPGKAFSMDAFRESLRMKLVGS